MRLVHKIIKHFHQVMHIESELFLSLLNKLIDPEHAPFWQRAIVLEVYIDICNDYELVRSIFKVYDMKEASTRILHDLVVALNRIIVSENGLLVIGEYGFTENFVLSVSTASIKMQSIDQLDKAEPPTLPDTYLIYLSLISLSNMVLYCLI